MKIEELQKKIEREGWKWLRLRKGTTTLKGYGRSLAPLNWGEIHSITQRHGIGSYLVDVKELIGSDPTTFKLEVTDKVKTISSPILPPTAYTPDIIDKLLELERVKIQHLQECERTTTLQKVIDGLNSKIEEMEISASQIEIDDSLEEEDLTGFDAVLIGLLPHVLAAAPKLLDALANKLNETTKKRGNNEQQATREQPFQQGKHSETQQGEEFKNNGEYPIG